MKININSILCATDLSELSNISISTAVALAKEFKAKLYICHIIDLTVQAAYGDVVLAPLELQNQTTAYAFDHIKQLIGDEDIDWDPLITTGHPSDEIAKLVAANHIDLAVLATHGRSGIKRVLLGSVTERLMRILPCPILIVRSLKSDDSAVQQFTLNINKILVGCDFSPCSKLAFQYALSLAQEFESELHMVHVVETSAYRDLTKIPAVNPEDAERLLERQIKENMSNMIPKEALAWCDPKIVLLAGQPYEEIIKYTLLHPMDLIVLGIRGRNILEAVFTGSTTDRVLRKSSCPVLSVCPIEDVS